MLNFKKAKCRSVRYVERYWPHFGPQRLQSLTFSSSPPRRLIQLLPTMARIRDLVVDFHMSLDKHEHFLAVWATHPRAAKATRTVA